jgi:hypothetical protein
MHPTSCRTLRVALGLGVVMSAAACHSWHTVGPTPTEYINSHAPQSIRLTRLDSSQVTLRAPRVHGDTIVGLIGGGLAAENRPREEVVPIDQVRSASVRRFDWGKTLLLYLVISAPFILGAPQVHVM